MQWICEFSDPPGEEREVFIWVIAISLRSGTSEEISVYHPGPVDRNLIGKRSALYAINGRFENFQEDGRRMALALWLYHHPQARPRRDLQSYRKKSLPVVWPQRRLHDTYTGIKSKVYLNSQPAERPGRIISFILWTSYHLHEIQSKGIRSNGSQKSL